MPTVNINGGTLNNSFNTNNNGFITNFVLTGGTMSQTGAFNGTNGYNFSSGFGITTNASATTSTISAPLVIRSGTLGFSVAKGAAVTDLSVSGVIAENGGNGTSLGISKTGTGAMALSGQNLYTGGTTISAGTIRANNATSSTGNGSVTVGIGNGTAYTGGILGGNGTVKGAVTLTGNATARNGGIITAGADALTSGKLNTGNETWNGGAAYEWKIAALGTTPAAPGSGASGTPGVNWDDISMSGLTVSSGGSNQPFTIAAANLSTLTTATNTSTYSWIIGQSSTIPTLPGTSAGSLTTTSGTSTANLLTTTPSGSGSNVFALDTSNFGSGLTINGATPPTGIFSLEFVNVSGTYDLVLDYNAAPEPGTAMLMLAGALPVLSVRRRRRREFPGI